MSNRSTNFIKGRKGYKMINKLNSLKKDDRGQALVLVALSMVVLIGVAALSVDYGYLAWQKRDLQNAADAAALAAAWDLPNGDYQARANEYVSKYIDISEMPTTVTTTKLNNKAVRVEIHREYNTLFAKVLGINSSDVYAMAEAEKDSWYTGLLPLAYKDDFLTDEDDPGDAISSLNTYVLKLKGMIGSTLDLWGKVDGVDLKFGGAKLGQFSANDKGEYKEEKPNQKVIEDKLDKSIYGHDISIDPGVDMSIPDELLEFLNESGNEGYIIGVLPSVAASFGESQGTAKWGEYVILHFTNLDYDKDGGASADPNKVYLTGKLANVYNIFNDGEDEFIEDFFIGRSSSLIK